MTQTNTKFILIACLLLFVGFACGFHMKDASDKHAAPVATATKAEVPIHKLNDSSDGLKANELIAPDLWRLSVDPFWIPVTSPVVPFPLPALANFPAQAPDVQTSVGDKDVRVIVNLPGLTEKDVDVKVGTDAVTINGQKREEQNDKNREFQTLHQAFEESIGLPCKVDGGKAKATVQNGVLTISMPKADNGIAQSAGKNWH
jgi:HSP20 family molecular chaperone IbpA